MTVLEKIKRCVSLVWDFQEFYSEEDIEEFCRNELHTYPQHDEIMEYFKHIEELEKENAELKEKENTVHTLDVLHKGAVRKYGEVNDQLTKATEIIKNLLRLPYANDWEVYGDVTSYLDKAEQFLKEIEK